MVKLGGPGETAPSPPRFMSHRSFEATVRPNFVGVISHIRLGWLRLSNFHVEPGFSFLYRPAVAVMIIPWTVGLISHPEMNVEPAPSADESMDNPLLVQWTAHFAPVVSVSSAKNSGA